MKTNLKLNECQVLINSELQELHGKCMMMRIPLYQAINFAGEFSL